MPKCSTYPTPTPIPGLESECCPRSTRCLYVSSRPPWRVPSCAVMAWLWRKPARHLARPAARGNAPARRKYGTRNVGEETYGTSRITVWNLLEPAEMDGTWPYRRKYIRHICGFISDVSFSNLADQQIGFEAPQPREASTRTGTSTCAQLEHFGELSESQRKRGCSRGFLTETSRPTARSSFKHRAQQATRQAVIVRASAQNRGKARKPGERPGKAQGRPCHLIHTTVQYSYEYSIRPGQALVRPMSG